MIDFRYHIVSIVAIFLALAVGILLGAGPLQEDLGKALTNQVKTLRAEKSDLRTQLDQAQRQLDAGDEFATTLTPELVASRLGGYPIVLVTLPGADADAVSSLAKVLTASGATVTGTVGVTPAWTDPTKTSFRDQLATSLAPVVGVADDPTATLDTRMAALLARSLMSPKLTTAGQPTPASTQTLSALKQADLLTFDGDGPAVSSLAVVVAPEPDPTATADEVKAQQSGWLALARQLDAAGRGADVVGPPASADAGGLVAAVRSDGAAKKAVSTVDDLNIPMGDVATVYALREQASGGAGHYGVGTGATAVLPAPSPARS